MADQVILQQLLKGETIGASRRIEAFSGPPVESTCYVVGTSHLCDQG